MSDRRRINGPSGGTDVSIYSQWLPDGSKPFPNRPDRLRQPHESRKMCMTPSASGSAYLELESREMVQNIASSPVTSLAAPGLKLTCTVHGPRPLPRSSPFSPTIILSTHVKYAPFASMQRRGYMRDASERDLAVHLETALRGVIIGDRWPKSGVEVIVTVLEGEEDCRHGNDGRARSTLTSGTTIPLGMMCVLSGCITVASAAIVDAGIDCVDLITGGFAAIVQSRQDHDENAKDSYHWLPTLVLDPSPSEHEEILAACVLGYLPSRDEITDIWFRGDIGASSSKGVSNQISSYEELTNSAVQAALSRYYVLVSAIKEPAEVQLRI